MKTEKRTRPTGRVRVVLPFASVWQDELDLDRPVFLQLGLSQLNCCGQLRERIVERTRAWNEVVTANGTRSLARDGLHPPRGHFSDRAANVALADKPNGR
jgi:hypothetical protein